MTSKPKIQEDLDQLKKNLLTMATLVDNGVQHAIQSLVKRDTSLARQVITGDEEINRLENDINHLCILLLD